MHSIYYFGLTTTVLFVSWGPLTACSFVTPTVPVTTTRMKQKIPTLAGSSSSIQQLEKLLRKDDISAEISEVDEAVVRSSIIDLATTAASDENEGQDEQHNGNGNDDDGNGNDDLFTPLLGNYKVLYTLPNNPNENPVGGKWTRGNPLLQLSSSWQHLAAPIAPDSVAQCINVITLTALFSLLRISVLLRGDSYALTPSERRKIAKERQTPYGGLSKKTVRVKFDPPRIVCQTQRQQPKTLLCVNLGPQSGVILDTPFCNSSIRLGKGSKGSLFVFGRTSEKAVQEEWTNLLAIKPMKKGVLLAFTTAITGGLGYVGTCVIRAWWQRVAMFPIFLVSFISTCLVAFGSGGIEEDRSSVSAAGK